MAKSHGKANNVADVLHDVKERMNDEDPETSLDHDNEEEREHLETENDSDGSLCDEIPGNSSTGVSKGKWYHRFMKKARKGQEHLNEAHQEDLARVEEFSDVASEHGKDPSAVESQVTKTKWYNKIRSSKSNLIATEQSCSDQLRTGNNYGTTATKVETAENKNFKTMAALGIYGLLTPAMAAVPSNDEFDTVHKQIKSELGEDWELRLAAAHVDDALKGRGKHGKARSYFKPKFAQRCFRILDNVWYQRIFLLVILIHSLMIFTEPPSYDVASVHFMVFVALAICLVFYVIDLVMRVQFHSWRIFWANETEEGYWNGVQFLLVCCFWMDFIVLCTSVLINKYFPQPFRCLRLVMLLCRVRSIRHIFEVLAIIGTSLLKVLFIILVFIITFACVGVHLFMDVYNTRFQKSTNSSQSEYCCVDSDEEESIYIGAFDNVGIAILRLFVLLSTENYPEVMLPALRKNMLNFFFFGIFVFFGGFFLTAILLAIVVDSYWVFAKRTIKKERARERAELAKAWNLLDPLGLGALSVDDKQFIDLFRILKPLNTDEQNLMLVHLLDSQGDGEIDSFEWTTTLREALHAEFEEENRPEETTENKVIAKMRKKAGVFTESDAFSKFILCLILLHGSLFCLKWRGQPKSWEIGIHGIRTGITIIFFFEIIIRIAVLGKKILSLLEIINVTSVFVAVTFNCIFYTTSDSYFQQICITISSLAVVIRWLLNSSGTRKAFRWFLNIVPVMFDLVILLFVILYLLSTVAMEIFHPYGIPSKSQIYPNTCKLGFKDFWCSFLIMFQTLTTSNWHEIMNLAYAETKSTIAYFFFPMSYLIITMIVMNLFVAIAIEAANKLTSKRSESTANLTHQSTVDSAHDKPRPKFNETAKKILAAMAKNVIGSARVEETQDRVNRQPINSPTSTSTMTLKGTRKGSTTIILSPPASKRDDSNRPQPRVGQGKADENRNEQNAEDEDEDTEDYSGLSPKAKREKQLKNRMKKKRKARQKARKTSAHILDQIQKQVRAIASFRGSQPTDLDFMVGDTITVIATRDEWMQGECKGVTGWFPASHVVNWSAKVLHESRNNSGKDKSRTAGVIVVNDAAFAGGDTQTRPKTPQNDLVADNESLLGSKKPGSSLTPQTNYRIKMKSGDWRREILGDMTVMNAEEMRELNKVMRAELRAPGRRANKPNLGFRVQPNSPAVARREAIPIVEEFSAADLNDYQLSEGTVESIKRSRAGTNSSNIFVTDSPKSNQRAGPEDTGGTRIRSNTGTSIDIQLQNNDGMAMTGKRFPTVSISQLSQMEFPANSDSFADEHPPEAPSTSDGGLNSKDHLTINLPEEQPPAANSVKNKSGEMPEWAKKFAETKNINVQNVKFPEPTLDDGSLPGSVEQKFESE